MKGNFRVFNGIKRIICGKHSLSFSAHQFMSRAVKLLRIFTILLLPSRYLIKRL